MTLEKRRKVFYLTPELTHSIIENAIRDNDDIPNDFKLINIRLKEEEHGKGILITIASDEYPELYECEKSIVEYYKAKRSEQ